MVNKPFLDKTYPPVLVDKFFYFTFIPHHGDFLPLSKMLSPMIVTIFLQKKDSHQKCDYLRIRL